MKRRALAKVTHIDEKLRDLRRMRHALFTWQASAAADTVRPASVRYSTPADPSAPERNSLTRGS